MARDVVVTFDGMTMRGSLILGREKENLNGIIGCTLMDENVIKKRFETCDRSSSCIKQKQQVH